MHSIAAVAASMMGHQHHSKPVTKADVKMSKKHIKNRHKIDKMKEGAKKLKKSIEYNQAHASEHIKAMKDRRKELLKIHVKG